MILAIRAQIFVLLTVFIGLLSHAEDAPIQVDEKERRVILSARAAKQNTYPELKGAIEYIAVSPGGKEYESLLICLVEPQALHSALVRIGLKPGQPAFDNGLKYVLPKGGKMRLIVEWNDGKEKQRKPVEYFVLDTLKPMADVEWAFTASREAKDPASGKKIIQATITKNLISLHQKDPTVLVQNPVENASAESRYRTNLSLFPKEGTPVSLIIEAIPQIKQLLAPGSKRIHVEITGKVQGVGFREFVQRTASQNEIVGWVRNLANNNVELVAEGKEAAIQDLEEKLKKGPRGAKVDSVQPLKIDDSEILEEFEVRETPEK